MLPLSITKNNNTSNKGRILVWRDYFSEHSGCYYTILARDANDIGFTINIENPDMNKFEIPGIFRTGWGVELSELIEIFFKEAWTVRPLKGIYLGKIKVAAPDQLDELIKKFKETIGAELYIYDKAREDGEKVFIFTEVNDELKEELETIKGLLKKRAYKGFIQLVLFESSFYRESIDTLADLFSWWLWDTELGRKIDIEMD